MSRPCCWKGTVRRTGRWRDRRKTNPRPFFVRKNPEFFFFLISVIFLDYSSARKFPEKTVIPLFSEGSGMPNHSCIRRSQNPSGFLVVHPVEFIIRKSLRVFSSFTLSGFTIQKPPFFSRSCAVARLRRTFASQLRVLARILFHDGEIPIRARYAEKNLLIVPFFLNSPDFRCT